MSTIYTIGYSGWAPADLAATLERLGATLWDIRTAPWSKSPQWCQPQLRRLLGPRYVHMPALGNVNYKNGGPIELANPFAAEAPARRALERGPLALLCGCREVTACHRFEAAVYLTAALGAPVEHLEPPATGASVAQAGASVARGHVWALLEHGEPLPETL